MSGVNDDPPANSEGPQANVPLFGEREVAPGAFVFTSSAFALNSGVILGSGSSTLSRTGKPSKTIGGGHAGSAAGGEHPPHGNSQSRIESGRREEDGSAVLVDPGFFPSELARIAGFLESAGFTASRIVLTHSDWDHIVGPARFPGAAVVASSEFPARAERDRASIEASLTDIDARLYVARGPGFRIPDPRTLAGSPADLVWPGPAARLLPAGGHTRDGLMVLLRESRVLFAGDHLSDLEIPFVGDSIPAYRATLAMVRSLLSRGEIEILVPGHGSVCGRAEIEERLAEDEDYLARLAAWVAEVRRTVKTAEGILERSDEVVFRKGWENPYIRSEHRANVVKCLEEAGG